MVDEGISVDGVGEFRFSDFIRIAHTGDERVRGAHHSEAVSDSKVDSETSWQTIVQPTTLNWQEGRAGSLRLCRKQHPQRK
ncbi:MAG: hypothetical protein LLF96_11005 [Eubacteriales bacterium]|nr:hypothetical protein [Eubacteriales bacterium]